MLGKAKNCFLISHGQEGWCSTRLVRPKIDCENLVFWIGTSPKLRKVIEIKKNSKVTLAFENTKQHANLILYGDATIETDPTLKKQHWQLDFEMFYPEGPESQDYVLLRFEASRIELMNFKRNILAEPFGLKPSLLIKEQGQWSVVS